MSVAATADAPACDAASPDRIRAGDPVHWQLREFLDDEAALLDEERLYDWLELLADDVRYWMPVRASVHRAMGHGFAKRMGFFDDSKKSLAMRVQRIFGTESGWVEDPPSRTGRFVTNVRTFRTEAAGEYLVESNLLLTRSRTDVAEVKLLSARRRDVLRRHGGSFLIARRDIYTHQATLDMQNLAIFL